MSPVDVRCVDCGTTYDVTISKRDDERPRCPRCGGEEVLLAALAGRDTSWYWGRSEEEGRAAPPDPDDDWD